MPARRSRGLESERLRVRAVGLYLRVTAAFILGLYLPAATTASDLPRHFAEALHSWAILCLAPIAAWQLSCRALAGAVAGAARTGSSTPGHRPD
jgi:hypothetical protein